MKSVEVKGLESTLNLVSKIMNLINWWINKCSHCLIYRVRGFNYLIFLGVLFADLMITATSVNQVNHRTSRFFTFLEVWALVMTLWFLFDEFFWLQNSSTENVINNKSDLDLVYNSCALLFLACMSMALCQTCISTNVLFCAKKGCYFHWV